MLVDGRPAFKSVVRKSRDWSLRKNCLLTVNRECQQYEKPYEDEEKTASSHI